MLPVYSPGGTRVCDIPPEPRSRVHAGTRGSKPPAVGLGSKAAVWYDGVMTRDQVKEILDRILTWPVERQADVAHMVEMMERLNDEQVAEVNRPLRSPQHAMAAPLARARPRTYGLADKTLILPRKATVAFMSHTRRFCGTDAFFWSPIQQ
jgi:hypothetical protein